MLAVRRTRRAPTDAIMADICRVCGRCPENTTWFPFAMPIGTARERLAPCTPNAEVGQSHARLPVTHTDPRDQELGGRWYYYSRGCSDLFLNVGRTLAALNRIHVAVLLEQRLAAVGGASQALEQQQRQQSAILGELSMQKLLRMPTLEARKLLHAREIAMHKQQRRHPKPPQQQLQAQQPQPPSLSSDTSVDAALRRVAQAMRTVHRHREVFNSCSGPLWEFEVLKRAADPRRGVASYANLPGSPESMANLVRQAHQSNGPRCCAFLTLLLPWFLPMLVVSDLA